MRSIALPDTELYSLMRREKTIKKLRKGRPLERFRGAFC